ncbi:hypothetical protein LSH36_189g03058 [Paralvinella palmiformis]|uniref:Uncharacterized protein n=1 Tax=Paralvinella palmiformis TaxID=53620 RepID=A0AAD9JQT3_9ANNE|nr:hypothetical protein LSH36_189g03058 [Paralvinella palmiformis]
MLKPTVECFHRFETRLHVVGGVPLNRTTSQPNGDVSHALDSLQRPQLVSYNSSVSLDTNASAVTSISNQANSMPRNIRDPTVFSLISGQAATSTGNLTLNSLEGRPSHHGSSTSLASSASSCQSNMAEKSDKDSFMVKSHSRQGSLAAMTLNASTTGSQFVVRYDKLDSNESDFTFGQPCYSTSQSEADAMIQAMMEANLSSEVAIGVLDVITLYTVHFKDQLHFHDGVNPVMLKIFDLYMSFLQISQSETFPKVLFVGDASMCGRLCYEILRCCNSRLKSTRSEACALMYLLMRSNFEFCHRKSFTRVHLQVIVAVSELINDIGGLSNSRAFADSLSIINSYAHNDKAMQRLAFPSEVNDLTKRVRTVLMATAQMKEHQNDPEMLVDLQYCLAKSYTSTPELPQNVAVEYGKEAQRKQGL